MIVNGQLVAIRDARTNDSRRKSLYVSRKVTNGADIIRHYRRQGVKGLMDSKELHVTIAFSRDPVDWMEVGSSWQDKIDIPAGGPRLHDMLGMDRDAFVLLIAPQELRWRHEQIIDAGASWDWPDYNPHITIAYSTEGQPDDVEPFLGRIKLGPEIFAEIDDDWKSKLVKADP